MVRSGVLAVSLVLFLGVGVAAAADYRDMVANFTEGEAGCTFRVTATYGSGTPDVIENPATLQTDGSYSMPVSIDRSRKATITVQALRDGLVSVASNAVILQAFTVPASPVLKSVK